MTHNQFFNNNLNGALQTKYSNNSFLKMSNNNSNNINNIPKTSHSNGGAFHNNLANNNLNNKYHERYSETPYERNENNKKPANQIGNFNSNQGVSQIIKKRTKSYCKVDLQENVLRNTLNYSNNHPNKEIRDSTPNTIQKKGLQEVKKSSDYRNVLDNSNQITNSHSYYNLYNYTNNNNINNNNILSNYGSSNIRNNKTIYRKISGKSKAGRLYDGTYKTNQDSYLIKNKILNLGLSLKSPIQDFDFRGGHLHSLVRVSVRL